jgi:biotin carboxyl carrier protein
MEKNFKATVNDTFEFDLSPSDIESLDVISLPNSTFHLIKNNKNHLISVDKSDFNNKQYEIKINANSYKVNISNQLDLHIKKMGFSKSINKKENTIKAPMPGLILSVNVKLNQTVTEGETMLILEAMKMENAICAPKNGLIKSIHIKTGGTVEKGELLIEMA